MDRETLLAVNDFSRARLLAILDTIEKSGQDTRQVLAWRPGPGRAHIAWQAMHCAATHDRYLNVGMRADKPSDPALVAAYAGGSTPTDENIPNLPTVRLTLESHYKAFRDALAEMNAEELSRKLPNGRTVAESFMLLAWHEAHHQGQIHLTWNLYKQAHNVA